MLLLLTSLAMANPCGDADCPIVAELSAVIQTTPADPWDALTGVNPGDYADQGLRPEVLALALTAFAEAWARGDTERKTLTVIDYSMHSSDERMWVLDLESGEVLFNTHTAHGSGSGMATGDSFSNIEDSHQSNVGLMVTAETYYGKHGYSLRMDGQESGFNSNARDRAIVIHAADYMTQSYIDSRGRAGRSWGCPALPPNISRALIDAIKGGTVVFGYAPVSEWLSGSDYLGERGDAAAANLPPPTLRRGAEGASVERLQTALQAAGFYDGRIDGDFGRGTRRAVQAFQRGAGLPDDGVVGATTWEALGR